jgi:hypothetical protein
VNEPSRVPGPGERSEPEESVVLRFLKSANASTWKAFVLAHVAAVLAILAPLLFVALALGAQHAIDAID